MAISPIMTNNCFCDPDPELVNTEPDSKECIKSTLQLQCVECGEPWLSAETKEEGRFYAHISMEREGLAN